MPSITPIAPADRTRDRVALGRRYTRDRLVSYLLDQGIRSTTSGARISRFSNAPYKRAIIETYQDAIKVETPTAATETPATEHPDVQIVKRVLLKGKDCSDSYSHTVGMELIDGGTRVRVLQDGSVDPEDSEQFHTSLAALKAAVAALEAQV